MGRWGGTGRQGDMGMEAMLYGASPLSGRLGVLFALPAAAGLKLADQLIKFLDSYGR